MMAQFRPHHAASLEDLDVFASQESFDLNAENKAENATETEKEKLPNTQNKKSQKKQKHKSPKASKPGRQNTHQLLGKGCLSVLYRIDVPVSIWIAVSILRVFIRLSQFFDQLSDVLLIINILRRFSDVRDSAPFDKALIYLVLLLPLLPYVSRVPLLYRAVFVRLERSQNRWLMAFPLSCHVLYVVAAIPCFIAMDLYVYTVKLFSNLAETKVCDYPPHYILLISIVMTILSMDSIYIRIGGRAVPSRCSWRAYRSLYSWPCFLSGAEPRAWPTQ